MLAAGVESILPVQTVYFGGGTPSLLSPGLLARILETIGDHFELPPRMELTLEANPNTVSLEYLKSIKQLGVNRLSLGMQSANHSELNLLERTHNYRDVINSLLWARQAGIDDVNLDLMFGLPDQTIESWKQSLELAIDLQPTHFSLYALTLEEKTALNMWVERGKVSQPDLDLAADMYEWAANRLEWAGYVQYEISNWALNNYPGDPFMCKHNLQYWRNLPYIGLGAGAHGYTHGFRTANVRSPKSYIQCCMAAEVYPLPQTPATEHLQPIDIETEMAETMFMGLRLIREGVSKVDFIQRFNRQLGDVFSDRINPLISKGLLEWVDENGERLRLTHRGRLLGNQVFISFV